MLFLQTQDYDIKDGKLCIALSGFVLVFYTADICKICEKLKPMFNKLSTTVYGCTFAYMNISQDNMKIRTLAAQTGFTIDYVPLFILYENRMPVAVFELNENNLGQFSSELQGWLVHTTKKLLNIPRHNQRDSSVRTDLPVSHLSSAAATSAGRPKVSDRENKRYKTFDKAYSSGGT